MSNLRWDEMLSYRIEDSPIFESLKAIIRRLTWRLAKRDQRWRMRTDHTGVNAVSLEIGYEEVELRAVLALLPSIEEQVITLSVIQGYSERVIAMLMGCSAAHVHNVKKHALLELAEYCNG